MIPATSRYRFGPAWPALDADMDTGVIIGNPKPIRPMIVLGIDHCLAVPGMGGGGTAGETHAIRASEMVMLRCREAEIE
jgi:hypothetical protein